MCKHFRVQLSFATKLTRGFCYKRVAYFTYLNVRNEFKQILRCYCIMDQLFLCTTEQSPSRSSVFQHGPFTANQI